VDNSAIRPLRAASLALFMSFAVWAQTNVGSITGTVTDSSGASVPDCLVTATSNDTGLKQSVRTQENGLYTFGVLPAGTYTLNAEKPGFRNSAASGVILDASSRRTVNFSLQIGEVTETVAVSATALQVQTNSGEVGHVISDRQLSQVALNGRHYAQLLQLIPGAVVLTLDASNLNLSTTGQSLNGAQPGPMGGSTQMFSIDGAPNMDDVGNANTAVEPNADAIAEVKIQTSGYSAEFGGRSGGLINVVTKSGTQQFHGTLWEFVRNSAFDARSFFATGVPPLHFNDFGFTLGGPVYLPHRFNSSREKLFFFVSHEWRYVHTPTTVLDTVPTAAERSGDFSTSTLAAPVDPNTNAPFPNRMVPSARFSRNGPLLLNPIPLPNFAGPGGNYSISGVNRSDPRDLIIRTDYVFSPKTQINWRLSRDNWAIFNPYQGGNLGINPGTRPRFPYVTGLNLTHTFSPTTLNVFSFSGTYDRITANTQHGAMTRAVMGGVNFPELLAVNGNGGPDQLGPNLSITGFTGYSQGDRLRHGNGIFQWRDDFTHIAGSHSSKFGTTIVRSRGSESVNNANYNGSANFTTAARNTSRNALADVLLGNFNTYTEAADNGYYWTRELVLDFYAQDSWKVRSNLTLEFGMRYHFAPPFVNPLGDISSFVPSLYDPAKAPRIDPTLGYIVPNSGDIYDGIALFGTGFPDAAKGRLVQASDPGLQRLFVGLPRSGRNPNYNDWGPRFGFAWDPFGKGTTSVRGGYGIYYDQLNTNIMATSASNPPFFSTLSVNGGNIDNPGGAFATSFPTSLLVFPVNFKEPTVESYNLNIQHQLPGNIIVDAGYIGNFARHLLRTLAINQMLPGTRLGANAAINVNALVPYKGYANINLYDASSNSNYNSLQLQAGKRTSQGLSFSVNYTFSKAIDDSPTPNDPRNASTDHALSSINRFHVFNANVIYELPFFRKSANLPLRYIVGGWEVAGVVRAQSGAPNTVTVPSDLAAIGASSTRATVIADPNLPSGERTLAHWFNTAAFLPANLMTAGQFGNSGRDILIGPGFVLPDVSLLKNFPLRERMNVQFRAESFNFLNHPSFTGINTSVNFNAAGQPTQNFGAVTGAGPGRVIELGLKLIF
jgi:hypothetical protein